MPGWAWTLRYGLFGELQLRMRVGLYRDGEGASDTL